MFRSWWPIWYTTSNKLIIHNNSVMQGGLYTKYKFHKLQIIYHNNVTIRFFYFIHYFL
jgi:hypothetical protein